MDLGFKKSGFETVIATDNSVASCETLNNNRLSNNIINEDIRSLNFKHLKNKIDGIVGGPPCQPYSQTRHYIMDKKKGFDDEIHGFTVYEFFRVIKDVKPKFFFFENVDGFMYKTHNKEFNYLKKWSKELGYKISYDVINCADFGIPQTRKRFVCVGFKNGFKKFIFPTQTHIDPSKKTKSNKKLKTWMNCKKIISNYANLKFEENEVSVLPGGKHNYLLKKIPAGNNYLYFTKKRGCKNPLFGWKTRYWTFLLKLDPNRPSWTIQASFSTNQGPFHWNNRFLNICEIQKLQTIDMNHKVYGNFKERWKQIGNAFPTKMTKIFADQIKAQGAFGG